MYYLLLIPFLPFIFLLLLDLIASIFFAGGLTQPMAVSCNRTSTSASKGWVFTLFSQKLSLLTYDTPTANPGIDEHGGRWALSFGVQINDKQHVIRWSHPMLSEDSVTFSQEHKDDSWLSGLTACDDHFVPIGEPVDVVFDIPAQGDYPALRCEATCVLQGAWYKSIVGKRHYLKRAEVNVKDSKIFSAGKGENSWDQERNEYGNLSVPIEKEVEEHGQWSQYVVGRLIEHIAEGRRSHG